MNRFKILAAIFIIPFFLVGTTLALIFTFYAEQIGKLYFVDLAGAGVGGLAIIPLITTLGPTRIIVLFSMLYMATWWFISVKKSALRAILAYTLLVLFCGLLYFSESAFPIVPKIEKTFTITLLVGGVFYLYLLADLSLFQQKK